MKIAGYEIDKSLAASVALHVGVIGWGLLSFSTRSLDAKPQEALPVDIISSEQLSQITKGIKTGQKENPKPMAEKVAEPKPVDDPVGKVTEKKEVIAANDKPPEPKPPEKKPEPPKPVEKKQEQQVDPIAEALKKEQQKKPVEKKETKVEPKKDEKPKKERTFDHVEDRRPARQAQSGTPRGDRRHDQPEGVVRHGGGAGAEADHELGRRAAGAHQAVLEHAGRRARRRRTSRSASTSSCARTALSSGTPRLLAGPPMANGPAIAESAIRAIQQCQPYTFLPQAEYVGGWDRLDITFSSKDCFGKGQLRS